MITLRVVEALSKDLGRGIVRVDPQDMARLGAAIGDVVRLKGRRSTEARLMPTFPQDRGRGIIQVDELVQQNAGLNVGEAANIEKTFPRTARSVTLAWADSSSRLLHRLDRWGQLLDGLSVTPGDRVQVKPGGAPPVQFSVLKTWPEGTTRIEPLTVIKIKAKLDRSQPV
jgi:transitional endoplasmic reticulum ATPase